MPNNSNSNPLTYPDWVNCISCGKIDEKKEDTELIFLSCCHLVCAGNCYERIFDNQDATCPTCFAILQQPSYSHPLKVTLSEFLPTKPVLCNNCIRPSRDAINYCGICEKLLCNLCVDHHKNAVSTFMHELQGFEAGIKPREQPKCLEHSGPLVNYCISCDEGSCEQCQHGPSNNNNCQVVGIEDGLEFMKKNAETYKEEIRNSLQDVNEVQAQVKTKIGRIIGKEREDLVKDAQCIFTALISKLFARQDALRSEILHKSEETSRSLRLKQLECDRKCRSMSQYEAVVDSLIAKAETNEIFIGKDFMDLYRFAKSQFTAQQDMMGKFDEKYFETEKKFKI